MNQIEYQKWIRNEWGEKLTSPTLKARFIATAGLGGECGEVLELLKKEIRNDRQIKTELKLELGDLLHYLTVIARMHGLTLEDIMEANVSKLEDRKMSQNIMALDMAIHSSGKPT